MSLYLVTGGAGFIGSHLCEELVRRGERVRVVDSLITGKRANLAHVPGVEFIEGDLADLDVAHRAAAGVDYVLHQAAIPSVPRSVTDPITSNRANIDATLNVLVAARDAGVKRLVYAGSSSAYGDTPTLPKREDMPTKPLSPYALQKLVGEQYLALFTKLYGLETVTTRYFNVFGPRQDPVVAVLGRHLAVHQRARRRRASRSSTATASRRATSPTSPTSWTACCAPATRRASRGEMMNVATGGRISLNELLSHAVRACSACRRQAVYREPRAGDVRDSQADISRAKALTGYAPTVDLREGLERTLAWFRS